MKKAASARRALLVALSAALVAGALALAGCSCSSTATVSSSAPASDAVAVPNVVSLSQQDAEKALVAAGFAVGDVKREASDTVPAGNVISQDPKAAASAAAGTKVNLVVSSGKDAPKEVTVPDLKGKTQADAEKALTEVGLVGVASNPEESAEVQPGQVFKQSVAAGTSAKEGDKIAFTVALAPAEVAVPNVVGKVRDDAKAQITGAKLGFDYTTAYSDSVAEGVVISQSVAGGTKVKSGTTVSVVVSLGAKPASNVKVPDVSTYSWQDAEASLNSAGLKARYTGNPNGYVVAQDVAAGTMVASGTLVTVTLAGAEPGQNPVMNYVGVYGDDRMQVYVEPSGATDARITITGSNSATEDSKWVITGTFDANAHTVKYTGCVKTDCTYDGDGNIVSEQTVYTDGTGTITLYDADALYLTWDDQKEHAGDGRKFTYNYYAS